jgi:uncharacterized protein involved in exopolysaccharide biosynthesis
MNDSHQGTQASPFRQASAREFFAVLFRRKWIIVGLFLVTTATVLAVAVTTPKLFASSGRILVKRGERQTMLRPDRQVLSDWEQELGSEMQIIKSVAVIKRARELLLVESQKSHRALTLDPASVDVEVMGKSNVIAVGYADLDPNVAQAACRVVMEAYIEYRSKGIPGDRPNLFFEHEIASLTAQIEARMQDRQSYTEQTGVTAPAMQTSSWVQQSAMLEGRRSDLAADLAAAQSIEQGMKKMQEDPDLDLPSYDGVNQFTNESALIQLKGRVLEQQARIAMLTETLRDDAPEVVGAHQTLETLQGMLRKEVEQRVRLTGSRVATLQSKVAVLDQEIAAIHQQLALAPSSLKKMEQIDSDLISLRQRLLEVNQSRNEALITANTSADVNVVVLAPASVALLVNELDVVRLLLAPTFSLLVGVAIAFFIDGLDLTVRTANQAEEFLDLPVLASMSERRRRNG